MQKNKDIVLLADPSELAQACAYAIDFGTRKIAQLIVFLEQTPVEAITELELKKWFKENKVSDRPLRTQLIEVMNEGHANRKERGLFLIRKRYKVDLIEQYQPLINCSQSSLLGGSARARRRLKTEKELAHPVFINSEKVTYEGLEEHLLQAGLRNRVVIDFLHENLNREGLMIAFDYHANLLRRTSLPDNEERAATYLEVNAGDQSVSVRFVCSYRKKLKGGVLPMGRSPVSAESRITLRIADVTDSLHSEDHRIQVRLIEGAFEVLDPEMKKEIIRHLGEVYSRKLVNGDVINKNDELIRTHILTDYFEIYTVADVIARLIKDGDPLKIFLMAQVNGEIVREVANRYELLSCLCADVSHKEYLGLLACYYSYDVGIVRGISLLLTRIDLLRDDKLNMDEKTKKIAGYLETEDDRLYTVASLLTIETQANTLASPVKNRDARDGVMVPQEGLPVSMIISLLKDPHIRARLKEEWIVGFAMRYAEVARWVIDSAAFSTVCSFTPDQTCLLLRRFPGIWSKIQVVKSTGSNLSRCLAPYHLRALTIYNASETSKEIAINAILRDDNLFKKLVSGEGGDSNELLRFHADNNLILRRKNTNKFEAKVCELVEICDRRTVEYYFDRYISALDEGEFCKRFKLKILNTSIGRHAEVVSGAERRALISAFCQRIREGYIASDHWCDSYTLSSIAGMLQKEPKLASILMLVGVRQFLSKSIDRGCKRAFIECVVSNYSIPELRDAVSLVSVLGMLNPQEMRDFLADHSKRNATVLINLIINDSNAIELLICADIQSNGNEIDFLLDQASIQQLLLLLIALISREKKLNDIVLAHEKIAEEYQEKITLSQAQIKECEDRDVSSRHDLKISSPLKGADKLEYHNRLLVQRQATLAEIKAQIELEKRDLLYVINLKDRIIQSKAHLVRLMRSDHGSVVELACLMNICPNQVAEIVEGEGGHHSDHVTLARAILRPVLSEVKARALGFTPITLNSDDLALLASFSTEEGNDLEAGNLLCTIFIQILKGGEFVEECLRIIFHRIHVLHLLINPMSVQSSNVAAFLQQLLKSQKIQYFHSLINSYLVSSFSNNDLLAGIINTPLLRDLIVRHADLRLVAQYICLFGIRGESPSDWRPFFERLIQDKAVLDLYRPHIEFHYPEASKIFFHFFSRGENALFSERNISDALEYRLFDMADFIFLLLNDYQANISGACRNQLLNNPRLLAEVLIFSTPDILAEMLMGEIRLRFSGLLEMDFSVIESSLRDDSILNEIIRSCSLENLALLLNHDRTLIAQDVVFRKKALFHDESSNSENSFLGLVLRLCSLSQFIELVLNCNIKHPLIKRHLASLEKLFDIDVNVINFSISIDELVSLLCIADQQDFDLETESQSELAVLLNDTDVVCNLILAKTTPPSLVLRSIPIMIRYLRNSHSVISAYMAKSPFFSTLVSANVDEIILFLASHGVKDILLPQKGSHLPHHLRKFLEGLVCRLFLCCTEADMLHLARAGYAKIFLSNVSDYTAYSSMTECLVVPRIITLMGILFHHQPLHAEAMIAENDYLPVLFSSSKNAMSLLKCSLRSDVSGRILALFNGDNPVAMGNNHPNVENALGLGLFFPRRRLVPQVVVIARTESVLVAVGSNGDSDSTPSPNASINK